MIFKFGEEGLLKDLLALKDFFFAPGPIKIGIVYPRNKYYKDLNVNLIDIDARGTEDEIFQEISKFIVV